MSGNQKKPTSNKTNESGDDIDTELRVGPAAPNSNFQPAGAVTLTVNNVNQMRAAAVIPTVTNMNQMWAPAVTPTTVTPNINQMWAPVVTPTMNQMRAPAVTPITGTPTVNRVRQMRPPQRRVSQVARITPTVNNVSRPPQQRNSQAATVTPTVNSNVLHPPQQINPHVGSHMVQEGSRPPPQPPVMGATQNVQNPTPNPSKATCIPRPSSVINPTPHRQGTREDNQSRQFQEAVEKWRNQVQINQGLLTAFIESCVHHAMLAASMTESQMKQQRLMEIIQKVIENFIKNVYHGYQLEIYNLRARLNHQAEVQARMAAQVVNATQGVAAGSRSVCPHCQHVLEETEPPTDDMQEESHGSKDE
ncbi:hypothetical protein R1flu_015651 [Riccia fluitans]|uniref:Uncharacterized protein n=1 Tax=Riccia fluitans TaxID=41844 RepID=A0ABD1YJW1_9MARC